MHTGPETAAADVEQGVVRLKSLRAQEVELQASDLLPEPTDCLPVPRLLVRRPAHRCASLPSYMKPLRQSTVMNQRFPP